MAPVSDRGGKLSPVYLGILSVPLQLLLLPAVLAVRRGRSELREVARREEEGHWSPEHREIRTGAVWAMALVGAAAAVMGLLGALVWLQLQSVCWRCTVATNRGAADVTAAILSGDPSERAAGLAALEREGDSLPEPDRRALAARAAEGDSSLAHALERRLGSEAVDEAGRVDGALRRAHTHVEGTDR